MQWFAFPDMEACVRGYFDFINISRYANLKGVTDPETYLKNIEAYGYATLLKYVDNLMAVIKRYDLTRFDKRKKVENMKIAIDAGHGSNTAGKGHRMTTGNTGRMSGRIRYFAAAMDRCGVPGIKQGGTMTTARMTRTQAFRHGRKLSGRQSVIIASVFTLMHLEKEKHITVPKVLEH